VTGAASPACVIVGGGITGLSAAYELECRGVSFTLLEASTRLGGLIQTDHVDGFLVETGPESVLAQKPAALQLCHALGLGPRIITPLPPRTAFVKRGTRLFPIPSPSVLGIPLAWKGLLGYDLLPPAARARLMAERIVPRAADSHADESVGAFFRRRFGKATVPLIAAPLLGGIHAGRVDSLSMHSLFPRFVDAEQRHGSVLRAFRSEAGTSAGGAFRSLQSGMGELVVALGRRLPPGGVRLASAAVALSPAEGGWRIVTPRGDLEAPAVVLAVPAYAASRLFSSIDREASGLCAGIQYASSAGVTVAYRRQQVAHPLRGSGFVVSRANDSERITACTWLSSKWAGRAPEGSVLLRTFVGSASDPSAALLSDDELAGVVARELDAILGVSGSPLFVRTHRWHDASPQHNVGHLSRIAQLDGRLTRHPGLFVAGSGFRSVGIPDCVAHGRAAGQAAAEFVRHTSKLQG
jgi:oxygen-dependent protoporphyrinogen oxidase